MVEVPNTDRKVAGTLRFLSGVVTFAAGWLLGQAVLTARGPEWGFLAVVTLAPSLLVLGLEWQARRLLHPRAVA